MTHKQGKGAASAASCSICAKPAVQKYHPFCSKRCADIDLHRWLGEGYRMPTEEPGIIPGENSGQGYDEY